MTQENIRHKCINKAYEHLRSIGKVHTKTDVATIMQASRPNVCAALNGDSKFLTDNFIERFNDAFDGIFNIDWLMTGEGNMLLKPVQSIEGDGNVQVGGNACNVNAGKTIDELIGLLSKAQEQISKRDQQIDKLLAMIDRLTSASPVTD